MAKTLFDHVNAICTNKSLTYFDELDDADKKTFSVYMVHRVLSMNPAYVPIVNEAQRYIDPTDARAVYLFYSQFLPNKRQFNKYIKATKDVRWDAWLLGVVTEAFTISLQEAKLYLRILYSSTAGKNELRRLCETRGIEPKQIKDAGL